jgi:hypothetical protein
MDLAQRLDGGRSIKVAGLFIVDPVRQGPLLLPWTFNRTPNIERCTNFYQHGDDIPFLQGNCIDRADSNVELKEGDFGSRDAYHHAHSHIEIMVLPRIAEAFTKMLKVIPSSQETPTRFASVGPPFIEADKSQWRRSRRARRRSRTCR